MPIPDDRCQRCTGLLAAGATFMADRDRVCDVCAKRAAARGETVVPCERVEGDTAA